MHIYYVLGERLIVDNRDIIQQSIDYIEENLKTDISANELSTMAGFSLFHYYRLFQAVTGMPVMQFVLRRRLINAVFEIAQEPNVPMVDVELCYGFDTHAGFFKAFKREYGCSPSQFLRQYKVRKPYKINLKQEEHYMITHKKLSNILCKWGLENEPISDIYYEGTGNKNENAFYVGDNLVVKATANLGALINHIKLSKALENTELIAATPISTKDDKEYVQDGELYFSVTKRLNGQQMISGEMYRDDYQTKARYLGEIIGQLHSVLKNCDGIICNETDIFDTVSNWALPKAKDIMNLPDSFCKNYLDAFGKLYPELPKHIIHRDPNPGNIILDEGRLTGFIDFELSEVNIRLFDPCYASTAILSESFTENNIENLSKWFDIYQNIIYGYDSVAKLSDAEKKAIPYVIFSIQMICVAYFSNKDKYAELAETNRMMFKWLIENKKHLSID